MLRKKLAVITVTAVWLVMCLMSSGCMFTRVTYGFTTDSEAQNGFHIPQGSVIYHWANGITEVYGRDNKRILIAKDSLDAFPTPGGMRATTHVYLLSGGSAGTDDRDEITKTDKFYVDDVLVMTVVEKPEKFPLVSLGIFYVPLPGFGHTP